MVNVNKLKGKIVECGLNIAELAERIGLDKATLYRKINNNCESVSIREANLIAKELHLTADDIHAIFFNQYVA